MKNESIEHGIESRLKNAEWSVAMAERVIRADRGNLLEFKRATKTAWVSVAAACALLVVSVTFTGSTSPSDGTNPLATALLSLAEPVDFF